MKRNERILIQLTKAVRLLKEEHYNAKTTKEMENLISELREEMGVQRVCVDNGKIEYKDNV